MLKYLVAVGAVDLINMYTVDAIDPGFNAGKCIQDGHNNKTAKKRFILVTGTHATYPGQRVTQMVAAVVTPLMPVPPIKITPAPTKPIPVTILLAIRSGDVCRPISIENMVNRAEPRQISISVRRPADLLWYSLSAPIMPPINTAIKKLYYYLKSIHLIIVM